MASFKLGINMAGAISAGAYTAGVLDFLTEALDEWYKAKAAGQLVPGHDVSIEVFSGASAGGMCAAISAVMLQREFEHIHDIGRTGTTNSFYESWVNKIDICRLLQTDDLQGAEFPISLLDSTVIREIATYALNIDSAPRKRPYVSSDLTLFLSLTNLRGTPYSLNASAPGSIEETTFFFGDRIRFQTTATGGGTVMDGPTRTLDLLSPGAKGGWDVLQSAAIATGGFPVFLAPSILQRFTCEYTPPHWESVVSAATGTPPPVKPQFPKDFKQPFQTLNVDGGVTNNDPFNYAHDYLTLCGLRPGAAPDPRQLAGDPEAVDRAVITVAPFPTTEAYEPEFDPKSASVLQALPRMFSALISQSRFFGESLSNVMSGTTFNRFVIAPSDSRAHAAHEAGKPVGEQPAALQCAALGAFGGFFHRGFRAHDFELGRRNCQKFLRDSFVLPASNPLMSSWYDSLSEDQKKQVEKDYRRGAPGKYADEISDMEAGDIAHCLPAAQKEVDSDVWFPIIPLCSTLVSDEVLEPKPCALGEDALDEIIELILGRYKALVPFFINLLPSQPARWFLRVGQPAIRSFARGMLREKLIALLGDAYGPANKDC